MRITLSSITLAGAGTHFIYNKLVIHRKNNSGLHFPIIDFYEKQTKRHYKALKQFNCPTVDLTGNKLQIIKSTTHIHKIQKSCIAKHWGYHLKTVFLKLLITYSLCDMKCCSFSVWQKSLLEQLRFNPVSKQKLYFLLSIQSAVKSERRSLNLR